jgi:hypothetical protein
MIEATRDRIRNEQVDLQKRAKVQNDFLKFGATKLAPDWSTLGTDTSVARKISAYSKHSLNTGVTNAMELAGYNTAILDDILARVDSGDETAKEELNRFY